MFRSWPLLAALLVLLVPPLRAQGELPTESGAELSVYVMTMGPGPLVWERFGHNAIWIHDPVRGTDKAYNFGLFDFNQENFVGRFIQGRMLYWMEGFDAGLTVEHYRRSDRSVWVQELNLTPGQKLELQRFLEWNERPENRFYRYDYYRDNCSTRVRDAIDRVLGGRIREQTEDVPTGATYRSHTRRLTSDDLPTYTGLMLALGQPVDRPISAWEEMFLPLRLREHLRGVTVRDARGREVPLVKSEQTLYESTGAGAPESAPDRIPAYLVVGLLLGGLLALLGRLAFASRGARLAFAALGGLLSLLAGIGGVVLVGLWAFTDHAAAYRNENLFQLTPLWLALVVLLPALAYGARWAARPARWIVSAAAAMSVLGFVSQILPGIDQVNGEPLALLLPVHLGLAWAVRPPTGRERAGETGESGAGSVAARRVAAPRATGH